MRLRMALIAGLLTLPATAQTPTQASKTEIEAVIATLPPDAPGCAINISQHGKTLIETAWGMASLELGARNTTSTIFEAGSSSKQFTAAAILLLERDGKLKLTDDIRKYVPEMPDYGDVITIDDLLHHTSGLREWSATVNATGYFQAYLVGAFTNAEAIDIASRQKSLNHNPGAVYSYTGTGYILAAEIVARVSGKSFQDFTRERLFEPLGMKNTSWRDDFTRIQKNRSVAYWPSPKGFVLEMPQTNVIGGGGMLTTIGDLALWNNAMLSDQLGLRQAMETQGVLADGRKIVYARGVEVLTYNGVTEISHTGGSGGYAAWLARYPEPGIGVALLCNGPPPNGPGEFSRKLTNFLLPPKPSSPPTKQAVYPDPSAYAGRFAHTLTGVAFNVIASNGVLRVNGAPLTRLSADRWTARGEEFHFMDTDRVEQFAANGNRFEYARVTPVTPTREQLMEFTGTYRSEEARGGYHIALEGDQLKLQMTDWPSRTLKLAPSYKDAFSAVEAGALIRFYRDRAGRITQMSWGDGRMWDLRANRMD